MVGRTVSHYRVVAELGSGGMGVVYRAEDTRLGHEVALNFLSGHLVFGRGALDRFQREARAASALNHPHICTISDIDDPGGQPFIAMELLEGEPLRARLAYARLSVTTIVDVGIQLPDRAWGHGVLLSAKLIYRHGSLEDRAGSWQAGRPQPGAPAIGSPPRGDCPHGRQGARRIAPPGSGHPDQLRLRERDGSPLPTEADHVGTDVQPATSRPL